MSSETRHRLWLAAKTLLALAIVVGIARYFLGILSHSEFDAHQLNLRFELLVLAGLLYLLAHCCWAIFWIRLLHGQGIHVAWGVGLRAYFISQFGKYVPGKAWVILIRVGILRHYGGHPLPVAITATYETLCSMAAGALLGVLLLPQLGVLPIELSSNITALVAMAALPVALGVLNKFAAKVVARKRGPDARPLPAPSVFLLAQGLLHGAVGHCLLGLSLGLTIAAVAPQSAAMTDTYPADLGATAISYVAGFIALVVPGGLGVREWVLQIALTPRFAEAMGSKEAAGLAVVIALILRLVWTAAEVLLAAVLYFIPYPPPELHHHAR
ncbi:MAG: flippase-like domain-containing protein [Planctomycetes bacterium]|nr:flippase-like domain-containing protein [Planctomycetota bacterium]